MSLFNHNYNLNAFLVRYKSFINNISINQLYGIRTQIYYDFISYQYDIERGISLINEYVKLTDQIDRLKSLSKIKLFTHYIKQFIINTNNFIKTELNKD